MTTTQNIVKEINLEHSRVLLRKDGIIEIICQDDFQYDVIHLREMLVSYEELIGKNKALILIIGQKYTTISSAGRKFSATKEATAYSKAEAFVIHSLAQRILANFYMKMDKPAVPTSFFTNKVSAEIGYLNLNKFFIFTILNILLISFSAHAISAEKWSLASL